MSYFIGGFSTGFTACSRLENILAEIVPNHLRADPLQISASPYLSSYGHRKVIEHVVIRNHEVGSWLAIIGTPLVRLPTEQQQQALLEDFLRRPIDSLRDKIDGQFAVFAYDAPQDRFLVATDLNNTTPVFYAVVADGVLFSSHELALAKLLTPEIDPFGFAQTIHLGVTWNSHTRFRNISKLLPCQVLIVDSNKRLQFERYWQPQDETPWSGTLEEHIDEWGTLLKESVWNFYDSAHRKPVIADFTAGEDSRLIVAQCQALGIPFQAHVRGSADDIDVTIAVQAAKKAGFDLIKRDRHRISQDQLFADAPRLCLNSDAYLEYSSACSEYATNLADPLDDYNVVKYCGVPGGEAFRGSYYMRGKALFPSMKTPLDYKFFTQMKYFLDYHPSLLTYPDGEFVDSVHQLVKDALGDVAYSPIGTQIDHMLRVFQTCSTGLMYKDPLYLPLATNRMTRSIYGMAPRFKRGGKITRACTEKLFPELAFVKTQSGVPTIRRTMRRQAVFMPECISVARTVLNGAASRLFKWKRPGTARASSDVFTALLGKSPYCNWFSTAETMITGQFYNRDLLEGLLREARVGSEKYSATVGRIIGQEFALRWVYRDGVL